MKWTVTCKLSNTHLHYDVEGKVEQQVADGDGQQVGSEVIGSLYEAIGSSAEMEHNVNTFILPLNIYKKL